MNIMILRNIFPEFFLIISCLFNRVHFSQRILARPPPRLPPSSGRTPSSQHTSVGADSSTHHSSGGGATPSSSRNISDGSASTTHHGGQRELPTATHGDLDLVSEETCFDRGLIIKKYKLKKNTNIAEVVQNLTTGAYDDIIFAEKKGRRDSIAVNL